MSEPTTLLWVDIETTGLDKHEDYLLELACFATTPDLEKIDGTTRHWIIKPEEQGWALRLNPFVRDMHEVSNLIDDVIEVGMPPHHFIHQFVSYLLDVRQFHNEDEKVTMAGSGVGPFDLPFLLLNYPELEEHFTYYVMDVGVIGRFYRNILHGDLPEELAERPKVNHRALDDINDHYNELLIYRDMLTTHNHSSCFADNVGRPS